MQFSLPHQVSSALSLLENNGFEAYIVGGCVRDFIMGRIPADFDITTNALPLEVKAVFKKFKTIDTGINHGTVTAIIENMPLEITTYRIDGNYSDSRHPVSVSYTKNLEADLSRRDFTMNAIAYNNSQGILDPFNGIEAINCKEIVCVGNPELRFSEDALRIMRAIRFSSQLGFSIEKQTKKQIHILKPLLQNISIERFQAELNKLIMGIIPHDILMEFSDVITELIPEFIPSIGFSQHSKYHKYDVWEHTAYTVQNAIPDFTVRLAMLFHDIGKPCMLKMDNEGHGHFKQHAPKGAEIAKPILKRLRYDNKTIETIVTLIAHHSDELKSVTAIRKLISKIGTENFFILMELYRADAKSKQDFCINELKEIDWCCKTANKIIADNECLKISDLAINGNDLINLGFSGIQIGKILNFLLEEILNSKLENKRDILLKSAENLNL